VRQIGSAQKQQQKGTENDALNLEQSTRQWVYCRRIYKKNLQKTTWKTLLVTAELTQHHSPLQKILLCTYAELDLQHRCIFRYLKNNRLLLAAWS